MIVIMNKLDHLSNNFNKLVRLNNIEYAATKKCSNCILFLHV